MKVAYGNRYQYSEGNFQTFQNRIKYVLDQFMRDIKQIRIYKGTRPTDAEFELWTTTSNSRASDLLVSFSVSSNSNDDYKSVNVPVNNTVAITGTASWAIMISDPNILGRTTIKSNCAMLCNVGTPTQSSDVDTYVFLDTLDLVQGENAILEHCGLVINDVSASDYYVN